MVLLVQHFAGTVAGCFQEVDAEPYRDRRFGAVGLYAVAFLVALISLSVISRWFIARRLTIRHYEQAFAKRDEHREKVVEAVGILATRPCTTCEYQ